MNDERFEGLMRDAAETYRTPPVADFDAMWSEIYGRLAAGDGEIRARIGGTRPFAFRRVALLSALAATLVIGIAIGRISTSLGAKPAAPVQSVATTARAAIPYEEETSRYLGQTAALLIALPSEVKAGRADEQFVGRASELLTRTRLLLDSPAGSDPQMRNLLEDLELVLAQVVRLQNDTTSRTELDLISRALEQRDVILRLRTAVADIAAN